MIRQTIRKSLLDIQHFRHEYPSIVCKIRKKRNNNQDAFHKFLRKLTCRYISTCVLIRYTISESLVEIQQYKHECSIIMYENALKRYKIKWHSITCSHIWHVDISKCVYWLDNHSVKVWWRYVLPNANAAHFCDIIFQT